MRATRIHGDVFWPYKHSIDFSITLINELFGYANLSWYSLMIFHLYMGKKWERVIFQNMGRKKGCEVVIIYITEV